MVYLSKILISLEMKSTIDFFRKRGVTVVILFINLNLIIYFPLIVYKAVHTFIGTHWSSFRRDIKRIRSNTALETNF
jgi:hypothetical protein